MGRGDVREWGGRGLPEGWGGGAGGRWVGWWGVAWGAEVVACGQCGGMVVRGRWVGLVGGWVCGAWLAGLGCIDLRPGSDMVRWAMGVRVGVQGVKVCMGWVWLGAGVEGLGAW